MSMKTNRHTEEKKRVQLQMPVDLWEKAQIKAKKEDLTVSQVIRKLLAEYIQEAQGRLF